MWVGHAQLYFSSQTSCTVQELLNTFHATVGSIGIVFFSEDLVSFVGRIKSSGNEVKIFAHEKRGGSVFNTQKQRHGSSEDLISFVEQDQQFGKRRLRYLHKRKGKGGVYYIQEQRQGHIMRDFSLVEGI